MISILMFLLLTLLQLSAGFGILSLLRIHIKRGLFLPVCLLLGIAVFSLIPFILQLLHIPIAPYTLNAVIIMVCIFLNARFFSAIQQVRTNWGKFRFQIKLYEIPSLLVIIFLLSLSVWRCYYHPPTPRDLVAGAEAIAEYTIREGTMINSVFSVDVSNNVFKPPFITSLQIIYKLAGFPFGQVWLSTIVISFVIFLYHALSERTHKVLVGLLLIFLLTVPELYAYTFLVLFDFPNAVFFCCSLYFLFRFFENRQKNFFWLAALLMGIATYIRSETFVLSFLLLPAVFLNQWKERETFFRALLTSTLFVIPALLLYVISVPLYINYYLPSSYPVAEQVNADLFNLSPLFKRFADINTELIFSETGIVYYGYFIFIFLLVLIADLLFIRRFDRNALNWLYAVLVIYFGFPLLGYLLPLLDLHHSTKRGLLKIFPLMVMYMASSGLFRWFSQKMQRPS